MHQLPPLMTLLNDLIAIPSVSSTRPDLDMPNRPMIDQLAEWLAVLGFRIEIIPVNATGTKANLLATLGSGPGGLVLAGHTDTVPFDSPLWHSDPLILSERDQRLYGLGVSDMKGFFPMAIEVAKSLVDASLQQPLIILATADEESSMAGARLLAKLGKPKARYAVIGEPTGLRPIRLHKGIMMESIRVLGQSGHSSNPALGINALVVMHQVLSVLLALRDEWMSEYQHPGFEVVFPTLNLGHIHGGDNPNRICGQCDLHYDIRLLPGMEPQWVRQTIRQRLAVIAEQTGTQISLEPLIDSVPPFEQAANSDLVRLAEKLTGHAAESTAFATEGPFLQQLEMETIVLGPGHIDQAHQPDEYMSLNQIQPAVQILRQLIADCCLAC
jgi:acetylornithine deacetylase